MKQKVKGVLLILLSAAIIALASQGTTPEERDVTVVLFLIPLGLQLIFSREEDLHTAGGDRYER